MSEKSCRIEDHGYLGISVEAGTPEEALALFRAARCGNDSVTFQDYMPKKVDLWAVIVSAMESHLKKLDFHTFEYDHAFRLIQAIHKAKEESAA